MGKMDRDSGLQTKGGTMELYGTFSKLFQVHQQHKEKTVLSHFVLSPFITSLYQPLLLLFGKLKSQMGYQQGQSPTPARREAAVLNTSWGKEGMTR